jgi:excinuclease ABC subunit C
MENHDTQSGAAFDPQEFVANLVHRPGVYRMYDEDRNLIYVGKAKDLKKRVTSYFSGRAKERKTMALVERIASMEVTLTNTEAEALLLEHTLIKRHRPRFNIVLRDDKSYPWIRVSTDHEYPRLSFYRGPKRKRGEFYGPYPSAGAVKKTLGELQKLFRVRQCRDSFFNNRSRPCLQYQIKRCSAPCVGYITPEEYARDVRDTTDFLKGRNAAVIDSLVERMETAAAGLEFEQAARLRDQVARLKRIEAEQRVSVTADVDADIMAMARSGATVCVAVLFVRAGRLLGSRSYFPRNTAGVSDADILSGFLGQFYLDRDAPREVILPTAIDDGEVLAEALESRSGHRVQIKASVRSDRAKWLEMARDNAEQGAGLEAATKASVDRQLAEFAEAFNLSGPPARIECFDISHTGGEATVASCVVFGREGPVKADYRRFNIRDAAAGDDYAAMYEALTRRYTRVKQGEAPTPDVVLIDGGKGQLGKAWEVMQSLELEDVALIGVAKGPSRKPGAEQLFLVGEDRPTILAADSPVLLLIQRIRDEAHRFAITGHRGQRAKSRKTSGLESVPGLGPVRRRELLRQFGGIRGVARAGVDDLAKVHGVSRKLAERIYLEFNQALAHQGEPEAERPEEQTEAR